MIVRARTVNAEAEQAGRYESVRKEDLRRGDRILITTENSVYTIEVLEDASFRIRGGWFDRQGLSPARTSIAGCTWGGAAIKNDIVAACGLHLEFGNRIVTSRIREVQVIREGLRQGLRFRPAVRRELLLACYGARHELSMSG